MEGRCIRGVAFCFLWYFSIVAGFYTLYCPLLPLMFLSLRHYRNLTEIIFAIWETYPTALMEILMGCKMVVVGDEVRPEDRALIIMNHRTRLDWNFLWGAMFYGSRPAAHRMKFVLKSGVRHFPALGWIMQMTCFLYIHRSWEMDQHLMGSVLEYFRDIRHRCQILLFPEGTDLNPGSKAKSDRYAEKTGLPKFERVLNPKTTGFAFLAQRLKNNGQLDAVYDITIAYPETVSQSELDMLKGKFPEEVHFRITRHPSESLPLDDTGCRQWLNSIWANKEEILNDFYQKSHFPENLSRLHERCKNSKITNALHLSLLFWTSLILFAFYAIFNYFWFQLWVLFFTLFFILLSFICDGLQHWEIALHSARIHTKKYQ